jgi:NAD/NADP transhydrogenase alpha subunit
MYERLFPMLMKAAGTIKAALVVIVAVAVAVAVAVGIGVDASGHFCAIRNTAATTLMNAFAS